MNTQFKKNLHHFIQSNLLREKIEINNNTELFETGLINSLKILDLIAFIELEIGSTIPDSMIQINHFNSINTIAKYFKKKN